MPARPFFSINEGSADRMFRVVLGLAVLALAFTGPHTPWGYLGLVPLLSLHLAPAAAVPAPLRRWR